jgi:flagellar basal body P-ring formation protein FlgA
MSRFAKRPQQHTNASRLGAVAAFALGASLFFGAMTGAKAQDDGAIVIPGNAETNPAAAAEMAKSFKSSAAAKAPAGNVPVAPPAVQYSPVAARPSDYQSATRAADAAMRDAARALEARAEAADASMDASDDPNSGMIVIPGPGQAKPAAAPVARVQAPAAPVGMMKASFTPAAPAAALPKAPAASASASASRDVTPVVVQKDDAASTRAVGNKPIAAGAAAPVSVAAAYANRAAAVQNAQAQQAGNSTDGEAIRAAALAFLQQQTAGLPGKVDITVMPSFPRGLAPCSALDPFMPTGARLWGRVTVGVRCVGDRPWTMYVQARISVNATYYLAARAIAPGDVLTQADLVARDGDLTAMPQAVITDPAQAVGATALARIGANLPLRSDMLRASSAVSVGQSVHVVADGAGFAISAEGSVMNNASPGQQVRVKTASGQVITGIVKDSQTVEIRM